MRSSSRRPRRCRERVFHPLPAVSHPDRWLDHGARSDVNETDGTITFDSNPGFFTGEPLTYKSATGQMIGGLTDGTYYAIVNKDSPDTLQLAGPVGEPQKDSSSRSTSTRSSRVSGKSCR